MTATVTDKLIAKAKELGLPPQTETFLRQADVVVTDAVRKAGDYTVDNRDKISAALDKAGKVVDEQTQGKYAEKIGKARASAEKGIDKLVEKVQATRPGAEGTDQSAASTGEDTTAAVPPKPVWAEATDPER